MLNSGVGPLGGTASATVSGGVAHFNNLADNMAETITLKFTSGTLASLPTNTITVSPAATSTLVIQTQPSSTATAGQAFAVQPVIYLEDSNGNVETSDNSTMVTVSLASGNGTLQGTKSVTVVHGVATFAGLSDTKAETISLKFSGDGLTAGPSNNITVSPAAPYQLLIHTQPSSAATAGQAFATQPAVYEVDQYGNLEANDSSTPITASLASGNGPLVGTTTANVSGGVATFVGLADNRAGMISLNFSGAGLTAGPSNNVFISPAAAASLMIQTPPYTQVTAGSPLTDPIVITEVDQYGNVETGDNSTVVTASQASGAGSLKGTMTAKVAAGVASFDDLENDTAGALTLQFSAASLPPVISAPSTVMPAAATHLVVTQPPAGVSAGAPFALTLEAEDNFGNVDTSYNGPVTVALANGSSGSLSGTTSMMASGGVATFANLVDNTSGPISLNATSGTLPGASTGTVTITPAQAAKLVIQTQPSQSATAGVAFLTQPVIYEEDQFGNVLTADNSTIVTAYLGSGGGVLGGTVAETLSHGVATFTNLSDKTAGNATLQFTGAGVTSIPSVPILINPAAASKLVIQTEPSAGATTGQALATAPVIALEDSFGNVETNDNSTQVTASLSSGSGPLSGTTTVTVKNGVATFSNLSDDKAETIALEFTAGSLTVGPSTSIAITPIASRIVIHTEPSSTATAGQAFSTQPVIYEEDQFGNVITTDNSTVVTASVSSGPSPLLGTTSVTMTGGVATFTNLADDTAETIALGFSAGSFTASPSANIVVGAAAPNKLVIQTQPPGTATAGQAFTLHPVVYEEDRFGNLDVNDSSTLITAALASGAGPLHGTTAVALSGGVATFSDLIDNLAESITLDFMGNGLTSPASAPIAVSPTTASKLVLSTAPSATATAGQPFATQPVVSLEDQYGNIESGDNSTVVTVSLASGAGPLQGTKSVTMSNGVAAFTNLADDSLETITLNFSGGGFTAGSPATMVLGIGTPTKLVIHTQPVGTATAGQAFTTQPVIYEEDSFGNLEVNDNSTQITATLASGKGPLHGSTVVTLSGGVGTFTNLADNVAGAITLDFTGNGLTSSASVPVTVSPTTASKLVLSTAPSATAMAGQPFATQPVVSLEDQYGNIETGDNSTVVSVSLAGGSGPLQGNHTATLSSGVATFTNLADDLAEAITLGFSGGGFTAGPATLVVSPAAASKLVIHTQPSSTATAGQALATQPVIYEEDQYGNIEIGDSSTVVSVSLAGGSGPLQGNHTATVSGGVATFTNLGDSAAETIALKFIAGSLTSPTTSTIQVAGNVQPAPTPTVLGATVAMTPKTKKKKAAFSGFKIQYSDAMNLTSVSAIANYQLEATSTKKKGPRLLPVRFNAVYDQSSNTVTLTVVGKNPFTKGGQLTIVAAPPNGVSSQAGVFLSSSSLSFRISANAKAITRG